MGNACLHNTVDGEMGRTRKTELRFSGEFVNVVISNLFIFLKHMLEYIKTHLTRLVVWKKEIPFVKQSAVIYTTHA